jgi:hypothetical protein
MRSSLLLAIGPHELALPIAWREARGRVTTGEHRCTITLEAGMGVGIFLLVEAQNAPTFLDEVVSTPTWRRELGDRSQVFLASVDDRYRVTLDLHPAGTPIPGPEMRGLDTAGPSLWVSIVDEHEAPSEEQLRAELQGQSDRSPRRSGGDRQRPRRRPLRAAPQHRGCRW